MTELLSFVTDYRTLLGRTLLGLRISDTDLLRLGALDDLLREPAALPASRRRNSRAAVYFPGALRIGTKTTWITVTDLSGGGLGVLTPIPLAAGDAAIVEIEDKATGRQYRLPVRIAWADGARAGLRITGVPLELRAKPSRRAEALECVV